MNRNFHSLFRAAGEASWLPAIIKLLFFKHLRTPLKMSAEGAAPEMVVDAAAAAGGAGEAAPAPAPVVEEPLNAEEALKRVVRAVSS